MSALTGLPLIEGGTGPAMTGGTGSATTGEDPPMASNLLNLLSLANASLCLTSARVYVGNGMPPILITGGTDQKVGVH